VCTSNITPSAATTASVPPPPVEEGADEGPDKLAGVENVCGEVMCWWANNLEIARDGGDSNLQ